MNFKSKLICELFSVIDVTILISTQSQFPDPEQTALPAGNSSSQCSPSQRPLLRTRLRRAGSAHFSVLSAHFSVLPLPVLTIYSLVISVTFFYIRGIEIKRMPMEFSLQDMRVSSNFFQYFKIPAVI